MSRRYLIVKLAAIGDVVMASTLIAAIRSRDADAHVTWLCGTAVGGLVAEFEGIDEVLVADEVALLRGGPVARLRALFALWRILARRSFDVTLLAHADARYRLMLGLSRLGSVRRLRPRQHGRMLPIPGRYFGDEYARLLEVEESRGPIVGHAPLARLRTEAGDGAAEGRPGVVLVPAGARNVLRESALRRWPVERYAALAAKLLEHGWRVTLVGDAGDAWVRPAFSGLAVRDEIATRSLRGTVALMARSDLVVSHDTGPLHLAALSRAPVLGLFGPTMPSQFMRPDDTSHALWGGATLACRPCYDGREFAACANNLCMQDIGVEAVFDRAIAMLRAASREPGAGAIFSG